MRLVGALVLLALLPGTAAAEVVVPDARGKRLDALGGVLTWVDRGRLMRFVDGRASRAPRVPRGELFAGDLGRAANGRVVLTMRTCRAACAWWAYEVARGRAARIRGLPTPRGCRIEAVSVRGGWTAAARTCRRSSKVLLLRDGRVRRSFTVQDVRTLDLSRRWLAIGADRVHFVQRRRRGCRGVAESPGRPGPHPQVVGDRLFWSVPGAYLSASLREACRRPVTARIESRRERSAVTDRRIYSITRRGIERTTP